MSLEQSPPQVVRWCAFFIAVVMAFPTSLSLWEIWEAERTGVVMDAPNPRLPATERVTKADDPEKFRMALQAQGFHAAYAGGLFLIAFLFYRRLSD